MSSGRINVRKGTCPVAGCKKETSRLDRHLMTHTELNKTVRRNALEACKRQKILGDLASLRASNPEEPMVSTLDIDEAQDVSDVPPVPEEEVEECSNPGCKAQKKKLQDEVADLSKQIDTLTEALRDVSRKYRLLRKRSLPTPSGQVARVTRTLLSAISSPEEKEGPEQSVAEPEEQEEEGPGPSKKTRTTTMAHPFPDHVPALNQLMEEIQGHWEGVDPTPKLRNNVSSKVFRIKNFLAHMSAGQTNLASFVFLDNRAKIRSWLSFLRQCQISEPTIHHYLKNVLQFLQYIKETPPPTCRLSRVALIGIRRELQNLMRPVRRSVAVHEVAVKQAKEGRLIPKATLRACREAAKKKIPEILDLLESGAERKTQWSFYGHLTAYWASIYGHRCGVFQNLTIQEVEDAHKTGSEGHFVINISAHKTNQAFGAAQLALDKEEYGWLEKFLSLRSTLLGGKDATYFFFTSKAGSCKNLNQYFQEAWASMGLQGTPTFTDVRTSIATHAKNTHCPDDRRKVAQFMCHDTATADRFYALNLNAKQAAEHRRLFETAVAGDEAEPAESTKQATRPKRKSATPQKRPALTSPSASPSTSASSPHASPSQELEVKESTSVSIANLFSGID
ncbi:hypothetical protein ROHU_001978 [Labeo rohita]|uniref:Uncharacterized protein n=1 Tax=Labeo rohita TaxID=84645 RepID=A0A498NYZ8_LABRO|nr:hypothetical protein ROHU_001978 [Labeo rohita]